MGRYLDLLRRPPIPAEVQVRTGDQSGGEEKLLSLSSLMSQSDTLSERTMKKPWGIDTRVSRESPFALSLHEAAASRPSSKQVPAPKVPGATKAIKATKPPQDALSDAEIEGMKIVGPVLLPDGRRLHRVRADSIPSTAPDHLHGLLDQARWCGVVLVADGCDLIVVERWLSA